MNLLIKIFKSFKTNPDLWFFYGFLITFTLSVRKVLFFYPINGQFNEYTGAYLYLSDIFLALALVLWGILILCNKKRYLSINIPRSLLLLPALLVALSFISIFWSDNQNIAIFRSIKLLEFYLLYIYIILNVPCGTFLKNSFSIIIFIGLFQAIIGIWQFIIQHSIGFFWLKESLISPEIPGVAKFIFDGERIIRAYGLFPHPNILAGFLVFSIIATFVYKKLFHIATNVSRETSYGANIEHLIKKCFTWNIFLIIQIIALILTFSKSAIIGVFIVFLSIHYRKMLHFGINVLPACPVGRCGTLIMQNLKKYWKQITITIIVLFLAINWLGLDWNTFLAKSMNERLFYLNVSRGTILTHPVTGIGSGQLVLKTADFVPYGTKLELWQYQPVHNVFLLIWSELGIIGLFLLIWWLWKLFHSRRNEIVPHGTISSYGAGVKHGETVDNFFKGLFLATIFIMLFDHYFWDIQQGQIMLWLIAGLLAGVSFPEKNTPEN